MAGRNSFTEGQAKSRIEDAGYSNVTDLKLAATAAGAAAGAATGGIIGALTQAGVSKEDADTYAEGVRRGGTLVSARVQNADRTRLDAILDRSAVNLQSRRAAWQKAGWASYDSAAEPYSADQVREERDLYRGV